MMCLWASYEKKPWKKIIYFATLKSMKKRVGSGSGPGYGSISQRYGSGDPDLDPHQNVTDPQHCKLSLSCSVCESADGCGEGQMSEVGVLP
jgi:hypothetical protein